MIQPLVHRNLLKWIFVLSLCGHGQKIIAQASVADSLERCLNMHPQRDSMRCELLYQLSKLHVQESNIALRKYASELEQIAQVSGSPLYLYRACMLIGVSYSLEGADLSTALRYFERALQIALKQTGRDWRRREVQAYMNINGIFLEIKRLEESQKYARQCQAILAQVGDSVLMGDNYKVFGLIYLERQQADSALYFFRKAAAAYRSAGAGNKENDLFCSQGRAYLQMGQRQQAAVCMRRCLASTDTAALPNQSFLNALAGLGAVYKAEGKWRLAADYYLRALVAMQQMGLSGEAEKTHETVASLYEKMAMPDSALYHFKQRLELLQVRLKNEREKKIFELEAQFRARESEQENALLRSEKRLLQKEKEVAFWSFTAIVLALLALAGLLRWFYRRRLKQKTEELEAFNYSVGHDLRAPLQNARLWLGHLRFDIEQQQIAAYETDLKQAENALDQLQSMLEGMLHWFSFEQSVPLRSPVDTRHLVADVWHQYQLHTNPPPSSSLLQENLPTVQADRLMLRQIFDNLISNAIKFSKETSAPQIQVGCTETSADWRFYVRDNGAGFAPCQKEKLFQLFKTVHPRDRFPGSGIGLALVKRLVEKHGGSVGAESPGPGQGATFFFTLPKRSKVVP